MITNLITATGDNSSASIEILSYPEARNSEGFFNTSSTYSSMNNRLLEDLVVDADTVYNPETTYTSKDPDENQSAYSVAISDEGFQKSRLSAGNFSNTASTNNNTLYSTFNTKQNSGLSTSQNDSSSPSSSKTSIINDWA